MGKIGPALVLKEVAHRIFSAEHMTHPRDVILGTAQHEHHMQPKADIALAPARLRRFRRLGWLGWFRRFVWLGRRLERRFGWWRVRCAASVLVVSCVLRDAQGVVVGVRACGRLQVGRMPSELDEFGVRQREVNLV